MGSNLIWEPANRPKKDLSTELKFALRKRYGEPVGMTMDESNLSYLQGLSDAGMAEADKLVAAIEKHGTIIVREEY